MAGASERSDLPLVRMKASQLAGVTVYRASEGTYRWQSVGCLGDKVSFSTGTMCLQL